MEKKRVLLIGSGGREHAIAWKLSQSSQVGQIVALPGNPGIGSVAECSPIGVGEFDRIMATAREFAPDLVVVGPENPIADGLTDLLRAEGYLTFGPSQEAGRIESEKSFSKAFLDRNGYSYSQVSCLFEQSERGCGRMGSGSCSPRGDQDRRIGRWQGCDYR